MEKIMLGADIGDIVGSRFKRRNTKTEDTYNECGQKIC